MAEALRLAQLKDKVAIIAGSGIGKEIALAYAREGARNNIRANVICPGFVCTPLADKQITEQAKGLNIREAEVVKTVMLKDTVDGELTATDNGAQTAFFLAAPGSLWWSAKAGICIKAQ